MPLSKALNKRRARHASIKLYRAKLARQHLKPKATKKSEEYLESLITEPPAPVTSKSSEQLPLFEEDVPIESSDAMSSGEDDEVDHWHEQVATQEVDKGSADVPLNYTDLDTSEDFVFVEEESVTTEEHEIEWKPDTHHWGTRYYRTIDGLNVWRSPVVQGKMIKGSKSSDMFEHANLRVQQLYNRNPHLERGTIRVHVLFTSSYSTIITLQQALVTLATHNHPLIAMDVMDDICSENRLYYKARVLVYTLCSSGELAQMLYDWKVENNKSGLGTKYIKEITEIKAKHFV